MKFWKITLFHFPFLFVKASVKLKTPLVNHVQLLGSENGPGAAVRYSPSQYLSPGEKSSSIPSSSSTQLLESLVRIKLSPLYNLLIISIHFDHRHWQAQS